MDPNAGRRVPLAGLYAVLGVLLVWVALYRIPMTGAMFDVVFRPDALPATPLLVDWPDGNVRFTAPDIDRLSDPPLQRRDRIVSIDGIPFETPAQVAQRFRAAGVGGHVTVVALRAADGQELTITSDVRMRSVAEAEHIMAFRVLAVVLSLFMPWLCLAVGFWVTAVRPRDPAAWLVLLMLLGRVGPLTLGSALILRDRRILYEFPRERPVVG